jgi:hypothetical protein
MEPQMNADNSHANGPQPSRSAAVLASIALAVHGCGFPARRWDLLKALTGQAPMSLREVARRAGCDVKAVHGDVHALLRPGVLTKTAQGKIVFPYDGIHIDFTLRAA